MARSRVNATLTSKFVACLRNPNLYSPPHLKVSREDVIQHTTAHGGWCRVIRVEHLTKTYGPRVAVADITCDVDQGEVLGFLGPNGAGKTTTMRILTGYLPPSGGRAEVAGFDVATQSLQARARIGYLPETVPLYHDMSVRSSLDFMAKIRGAKDRRREGDRAMEKSRLAHRAGDQIGNLAKGLRQRVVL